MATPDSVRIAELVRAAARLAPDLQASFLAEACAGDPGLRTAVESALRRQDSATLAGVASAPKETLPDAAPMVASDTRGQPREIGPYTVLGLLGEGGMGVVYLARQRHPDRQIALKVLRPGVLSPKMLRRFEVETEILGRLQHPGIAQIYDAGTAAVPGSPGTQQPYFAMELVRGPTLTAYAASNNLGVRAKLGLFMKVCDAVHHAHQKGVIHRDLKPGNILVAEPGGGAAARAAGGDRAPSTGEHGSDSRSTPGRRVGGQPKILDFGIARATDADMQTATLQTDVGQLVGTVPYMSPEQIAGDPNDVDVRSDVYTLGVILYELLTGRLPHRLTDKTIPEAIRIIGQDEPAPLGATDRSLRGDLQTIVAKALDKDRTRRYQSAEQLAADLGRFLRDEPIVARPPTTVYQLRKFARRNKGLVAGVAAAFLILVGGIVATQYQAQQARRGRAAAQAATAVATDEAANAKAVNDFLTTMLTAADPEQTSERDVTVREMLDRAADSLATTPPGSPRVRLSLLGALANTYKGIGQPGKALAHAQAAMELAQKEYGPDHRETSEAQRLCAMILNDLARYDESEPLLRSAYNKILARSGEESAEGAQITGELASLVYQQGKLKEAEPLMRKALRLAVTHLGPKHRDVMTDMDHLGAVLSALGRFPEAEEQLRKVLALRQEVYGKDHVVTAFSLNTLANVVQRQGRGEEAIGLLRQALEIRRKRLDPDHPSLIVTIQNLAVALIGEKRYDEAEPLLREAVAIQTRKYGEAHPKTLLMTGNLAYLVEDRGRDVEAEEMFRRIVQLRRENNLLGDAEAWPQINNLAMLCQKHGKLEEAETLFRETLALCRKSLPADHYFIAIFQNNLGDCLTDMKRYEDAEKELSTSLPALEKFFGANHARTVKAVGRLVRLYDAWGKPERAAAVKGRMAGK